MLNRACIKGRPDEEAVLCTATATYDLKHVETTNALLLVTPQQVRSSLLPRLALHCCDLVHARLHRAHRMGSCPGVRKPICARFAICRAKIYIPTVEWHRAA